MNNPYLNTPLSKLSKIQINTISVNIFKWARKKFKNAPSRLKLKLSGAYKKRTGAYGEYDFDKKIMFIYYRNIRMVKDLIEVVLHEFKHSLQDGDKYTALFYKYSYYSHPYEIAACNFSKKRIYNCWNNIQHNI